MANQTTISKEVLVEGVGLHTGIKSTVVFKPAPCAGYGIKFVRVDLDSKVEIEAVWSNTVVELSVRGSVIEKNNVKIYTVEHVMSACFALEIDNLIIEINNSELPILDGSAKIFTEVLVSAGIKEFDVPKEFYALKGPVVFESGKTKIAAYPSDHLEIECTIGYDHPFLKHQQISFKKINKDNYLDCLAPAKTFCFDYEIEALRSKGLALGGSMDSAVVIGLDGVHNKEALRYEDEFVRHKVLDLMGDLYLAGKPIKAKIVAEKPGHRNNINFVAKFLKEAIVEKYGNANENEVINSNIELKGTERTLGFEEILKYIPHRYPFLMIDRVKLNSLEPTRAVGYKCISGNENFFQGHFPGAAIMPGVLIVEAMAQTSCVMFLSRPKMQECLAYFMSIDKVKFRKPVKPGDVLELRVDVLKDCGRRGKMRGEAYVDGKITAEAEFVFVIVDRKEQL